MSEQTPIPTKPWYLSKTLWTNFILTVLVFIVPESIGQYLRNPEILAGTFAVVNFLLRFITKKEITIS